MYKERCQLGGTPKYVKCPPTASYRTGWHDVGNVGDTFEVRLHFKEFTRLELCGTWYKISDDKPWRVHFKFKKVDEAVEDKDYNEDNDKTDKLWIDNGSERTTDNEGWDE